MFTVLLLAGIEKVINLALATDPITQAGLATLSGKTMRLVLKEPAIKLDILFNDTHLRFEPVTTSVFEPKGTDIVPKPDCVVTADTIAHLLQLMGEPDGNLPIEGDYKVLMQVKQLMAGFDPDIIGKLQPIIGLPLASQLTSLLAGLKQSMAVPTKTLFADMADLASVQSGSSHHDAYDTRNDLKQELLRLQADIEREQARLEAIKAQQRALSPSEL